MNDATSSSSGSFWRHKKTYIWALIIIGIVDAVLIFAAKRLSGIYNGFQLAMMFAMNVAMLGWCYADAEERKIPISGLLRIVMLLVPIIGVPWYFLRARGFVGAAKTAFGLGLFALWFASAMLCFIIFGVIQILVSP